MFTALIDSVHPEARRPCTQPAHGYVERLEPVYERCVELLEAGLGDDIVGLEVSRGECFGFNAVAAEVWRRLPASASSIQQALEADYDVDAAQCEADVQAVLDQMVDMGLIRPQG